MLSVACNSRYRHSSHYFTILIYSHAVSAPNCAYYSQYVRYDRQSIPLPVLKVTQKRSQYLLHWVMTLQNSVQLPSSLQGPTLLQNSACMVSVVLIGQNPQNKITTHTNVIFFAHPVFVASLLPAGHL